MKYMKSMGLYFTHIKLVSYDVVLEPLCSLIGSLETYGY
jgi:hypothetical protein